MYVYNITVSEWERAKVKIYQIIVSEVYRDKDHVRSVQVNDQELEMELKGTVSPDF